jgi:hypothetical protein
MRAQTLPIVSCVHRKLDADFNRGHAVEANRPEHAMNTSVKLIENDRARARTEPQKS